MLKYSFMKPRTWPTRLFLALCLVACVSWLALWCFREPLPRDAAAADRYLVRHAPQPSGTQKEMATASSGQQIALYECRVRVVATPGNRRDRRIDHGPWFVAHRNTNGLCMLKRTA